MQTFCKTLRPCKAKLMSSQITFKSVLDLESIVPVYLILSLPPPCHSLLPLLPLTPSSLSLLLPLSPSLHPPPPPPDSPGRGDAEKAHRGCVPIAGGSERYVGSLWGQSQRADPLLSGVLTAYLWSQYPSFPKLSVTMPQHYFMPRDHACLQATL